ncbi:MAG: 3-hydroxyacyl-CoA dehydrogenase NAD-binding domain-containing protein [bacterium]
MDISSIKTVLIVGAGLMGSGIAQIFGDHGYQVLAYDVDPGQENRMRQRIQSNLEIMLEDHLDVSERIERVQKKIVFTSDFESAAESADFVVECVSEKLTLKQDVFIRLDRICRAEVPLASNTSVMSITEIASRCSRKERIIGTHFWNPPFLLPLVETVRTVDTSAKIIDITMQLLRRVGKHPILVKKDVPGFVANRLQHALWREAVSIVENGIADARTVDEAIKFSFGLRLPVLAPLENADMVGNDLVLAIHEYVFPHLENSPLPSTYLKDLVERGQLGFKTGAGFMNWTQEEQDALQRKLIRHLVSSVDPKR